MEQIQLNINDLYLDLENPRIVEATNQSEALVNRPGFAGGSVL